MQKKTMLVLWGLLFSVIVGCAPTSSVEADSPQQTEEFLILEIGMHGKFNGRVNAIVNDGGKVKSIQIEDASIDSHLTEIKGHILVAKRNNQGTLQAVEIRQHPEKESR